ncbi:MAG: hypothetical protein AAB968_02745 [Patescibacteria group bacterium]
MHCSLEFSVIGLPVAVHSQWDEEQTYCTLRIFTDRKKADSVLAELRGEERQDFEKCIGALGDESDEPGMVTIEGDAGLSLTSDLVVLLHRIQVVDISPAITSRLELMGFWGPLVGRPSRRGIVMWFHPRKGYHVVIAESQQQVKQVIQRLYWLRPERRQRLLRQARQWNSSAQSSETMQEIDGMIAEVLCKASMAMKIKQALERQEKAFLN